MTIEEFKEYNDRPPFDPFAYAADVKAQPEKYVSLAWLTNAAAARIAIRRCETMETLQACVNAAGKAAIDAGDNEFLELLKEFAGKRKAELKK